MPPLHGRHHDPGNQQRTRHPGPSMLEHTRPGTHANTDHAERGARTTLIGTKRRGAADRQHVPTVPTPDETGAALPGAGIHGLFQRRVPVGTPGGPVGTRRRSRPRVGCRTGEECSPVRQCPIMPHVSVPGRQGGPRSAAGMHQAASSFVACLLDGAPSGRRRLPGSGRGWRTWPTATPGWRSPSALPPPWLPFWSRPLPP